MDTSSHQSWTLTLRAVVSFPALQADAVALLVAGVVAQRVIPRPAVVSAAVSKVVLVTEDVVGVAQLALFSKVHVLRPVFSNGKSPSGRQTAHEVVLVVCRGKESCKTDTLPQDMLVWLK